MTSAKRHEAETVIVAFESVPELTPSLARVLLRILRRASEKSEIQDIRDADPPEAIAS